jgi:hypothetical protein
MSKQVDVLSSGFIHRDQETKYNLTLFDLLLTLATRVNASLKLSKSAYPS